VTKFADLHIHTFFSDGTFSPRKVVEEASKFGLSCISITDHDTLEGVKPAQEVGAEYNVEVISGVELSTEIDGKDVHILGYFIDSDDSPILKTLRRAQETRMERVRRMISKLKELGVDNIEFDEVASLTKSESVGRLHLATVLIDKGWVSNIPQAFSKYLGEDCPAYVPKYKMTPLEAIKLIKESSGVSVFAHPMATGKDELIPQLVEGGLQGLEVVYPNYSKSTENYYANIAKKHGLIMTGGSDAHGIAKGSTYIGKARIPYENVEEMKNLLSR